jgi:Helix-turn-helix domain
MSERISDAEFLSGAAADGAYTLEEFCVKYRIGRTAAYQQINKGRLEARKFGKRTMIPREAARQWFSALPRLRAPTAQTAA